MRELKFRAWNGKEKQFARWDINNGKWDVFTRLWAEIDGEMDDSQIAEDEQYTGLKDKNGKEIYEGDIVEQFACGVHQFKGKECGRKTLWQVRWNEEECCFELHYLSGSLFGDSLMSNDDEYEVIGNIHESNIPELMEGAK